MSREEIKRQTNGGWRLTVRTVDGDRRNIKLNRSTTAKDALKFKTTVLELVQSTRFGQDYTPKQIAWMKDLDEKLAKKVQRLGIAFDFENVPTEEEKEIPTISSYIDEMLKRSAVGDTTANKLELLGQLLIEKFGEEKRLDEITKGDALEFQNWLYSVKGLAKNSTVRRYIGYARQIWHDAISFEIVKVNPFVQKKIVARVVTNKERHYYITPETRRQLYAVIPDGIWRLRFVLLAYAGLRSPSEINSLRWQDIDWEKGEMTIRSSKTAHHENRGVRTMPILKEVEVELDRAWDSLEEGANNEFVLPRISHNVLTRHVKRWIGQIGQDLWPQLLINFRRSAVTDQHLQGIPPHLLDAWFGHSAGISKECYRMDTEEAKKMLTDQPSRLESEEEKVRQV